MQEKPTRERICELLHGRQVTLDTYLGQTARFAPETFRRVVEFAAEFGVTHVLVLLPFRYNSWVLPDNTDPYASWCNTAPALLRVCPPEELQPWVPPAQAQASQQVLRAQLDIIREYGLKAATYGVEPMWLPEGVYRAHPRWRGAQCELGRIADRPYFAPSIDEPEVLELYRRAMREFCTLFPEIERYSFLSNDSGGGIAWSPCLYPGMNGPARWRTRDGGERIAGWLQALQAGAAEAGAAPQLNIGSSGLPSEWIGSARSRLTPGLYVNGGGREGERWISSGAGLDAGLWSMSYPVFGLGNPTDFLAGLQGVLHNPAGAADHATLSLGAADLELARTLFASYLELPGQGVVQRAGQSLRAAEWLTGSTELAESLVGIWESVSRALHAVQQIRQKGFGLLHFATVSMRWLTRPLVPSPEALTPEETAHYRNFLFSVESEKDNPSFSYVFGKGVFRGESVMWMARWCLVEAINTLRGARAAAEDLARRASDSTAADYLARYATRIGAFACLAANAKNVIMYQYALDVANQPQYGPNPMDYDDNVIYDMRALNMRKIAREELDNIAELIEILESQPDAILEHAHTPEEESPFMLGPDVVADLKRKLDIMLDHWQDYERLYPTTKVWDFEPEPRGNIV